MYIIPVFPKLDKSAILRKKITFYSGNYKLLEKRNILFSHTTQNEL